MTDIQQLARSLKMREQKSLMAKERNDRLRKLWRGTLSKARRYREIQILAIGEDEEIVSIAIEKRERLVSAVAKKIKQDRRALRSA